MQCSHSVSIFPLSQRYHCPKTQQTLSDTNAIFQSINDKITVNYCCIVLLMAPYLVSLSMAPLGVDWPKSVRKRTATIFRIESTRCTERPFHGFPCHSVNYPCPRRSYRRLHAFNVSNQGMYLPPQTARKNHSLHEKRYHTRSVE